MIQKIINKTLLILSLIIILFILLPIALGFKLHDLNNNLVYSKPVTFEVLTLQDRLLIKDKQGSLYIDTFVAVNPITKTLMLENGEAISESAITGKVVVTFPFVGQLYTTLLAIEYDLKLQILVIILIIYITPEMIRSFIKKWRFHSQKMVQ